MSNLSPYAKPFDPATWCMEPRTPTPQFSPLETLPNPVHRPLSYAQATATHLPEPFPAYQSPPQNFQTNFHGQAYRQEGAQGAGHTHREGSGSWRSPIWNRPSRFNLHTDDDQSRPVGDYGIALDTRLPAFGQGKWVNGGPDRQEMAPIGFEMSERCLWNEQRSFGETKGVRNEYGKQKIGTTSETSPTASSFKITTTPLTSSTTPSSSSVTSPRTPSTTTYPATQSQQILLYSAPSTNTSISSSTETWPMQISANIHDIVRSKQQEQEKERISSLFTTQTTLSTGLMVPVMPVINMAELNSKFEVPQTLDKLSYESLSDFADSSVLTGNLTLIEGHIIARQLFHARCRNASFFAVDAAFKASAEVAACDAAEAATIKAYDAIGRPAASSSVSPRISTKAYIPAVSSRIGADALKATLTAFGQVTYFDINRQKRCAFVEFATTAQFLAAHNGNPHMVGEEIIRVEARRVKNGR